MRERVTQPTQMHHVDGTFPVQFIYTAGVAGEVFGKALRDKESFLGARCDSCAVTYVPPRTYCERCFARIEATRKVGPQGEIVSFTESHLGPHNERLADPETWGLIRLDGADTVLVHRLTAKDPSRIAIGARVKPIFRPKKDRTGVITDIESFAVL